jgi:hypothetical protein
MGWARSGSGRSIRKPVQLFFYLILPALTRIRLTVFRPRHPPAGLSCRFLIPGIKKEVPTPPASPGHRPGKWVRSSPSQLPGVDITSILIDACVNHNLASFVLFRAAHRADRRSQSTGPNAVVPGIKPPDCQRAPGARKMLRLYSAPCPSRCTPPEKVSLPRHSYNREPRLAPHDRKIPAGLRARTGRPGRSGRRGPGPADSLQPETVRMRAVASCQAGLRETTVLPPEQADRPVV